MCRQVGKNNEQQLSKMTDENRRATWTIIGPLLALLAGVQMAAEGLASNHAPKKPPSAKRTAPEPHHARTRTMWSG